MLTKSRSIWGAAGLAAIAMAFAVPANAQTRQNVGNWKLAEKFSSASLRPYVYSASVAPVFLKDSDNFWYVWREADGKRFMFVDPSKKLKRRLFDHQKLAVQLSQMHMKPYDFNALPFDTLTMADDGNSFKFQVETKYYSYDLKTETLKSEEAPKAPPRQTFDYKNTSPDKKAFAYSFKNNLFFVEGEKDENAVQLSTDGEKDFSFGGFGGVFGGGGNTQTGPEIKTRANVSWSPDSKAFSISRFDARKVKELFLVNNLAEPRPSLMTYKYAMPGEAEVAQQELWVYSRDAKKFVKVKADKWKDQSISGVHWPNTSDKLRFIRRDRLQRNLDVCEYDLKADKVNVLFSESVENAFLEIQPIQYVKPGGDFVWFSERSGWGHYYLYGSDGKLKNAITSGPWRAENLSTIDAEKGFAYFTAVAHVPGENPYYTHSFRVKLDGSQLVMMNPGNADHAGTLSTTKKYVVDSSSRVDMPNQNCVFDRDGKKVMDLEEMDLSRLKEYGWKMPETFVVKSDDGVTNIYGNMWKPFDFDPKKKYPIILNVYPGPQTESVSYGFSPIGGNQQLAQLGFIVIQIGNRGGSPQRSNAYHSYGYYNLRDYGLADKKAGVEQLAARFSWIDIDRVGIYGHSGGGYMTAAALLLPPYNEFFKVGVSSAGNHDNNVYNQNWSEQHHGLKLANGFNGLSSPDEEIIEESFFDPLDAYYAQQQRGQRGGGGGQGFGQGQGGGQTQTQDQDKITGRDSGFNIKVPTTVELAPNLQGSLLLVHGDMDNNVHPANTIRLVNALIKANKRFDFMIMPGQAHGFGTMQPYFTQMLQEYFCKNLLGDNYSGSASMASKKGG